MHTIKFEPALKCSTVNCPNLATVTTIRIRRAPDGPWLPVTLLYIGLAWIQVDDGSGPPRVALEKIHPADRRELAARRGK